MKYGKDRFVGIAFSSFFPSLKFSKNGRLWFVRSKYSLALTSYLMVESLIVCRSAPYNRNSIQDEWLADSLVVILPYFLNMNNSHLYMQEILFITTTMKARCC